MTECPKCVKIMLYASEAHLSSIFFNFHKTLVQRQVVPNWVLPTSRCGTEEWKVGLYPVVDFLHWQSLMWWLFNCHENETTERIWRLATQWPWGSAKGLAATHLIILFECVVIQWTCTESSIPGLYWLQQITILQPLQTCQLVVKITVFLALHLGKRQFGKTARCKRICCCNGQFIIICIVQNTGKCTAGKAATQTVHQSCSHGSIILHHGWYYLCRLFHVTILYWSHSKLLVSSQH